MLFLVLCYLPESPRWLYEKGLHYEAKQTLIIIANNNGLNGGALEDFNLGNETRQRQIQSPAQEGYQAAE